MQLNEAIRLIDTKFLRGLRVPDTLSPEEAPAPLRWADLGCGDGLFTLALSNFLPPGSTIYGIDRRTSLRQQTNEENIQIVPFAQDFVNDRLPLDELDGLLFANSLHYVKDKAALIHKLEARVRPGSPFLIVEYDTDKSVPVWVPYPLSFKSLQSLFHAAGYVRVEKINERPSVFGRSNLYSALVRP